jgi:hypothetical protein
MMRERIDERVRLALSAAKFDFARPDPRLAWQAFKAFAAENVPELTTTTIGYSAYNASDRDDVLWLSFVRTFEQHDGVGWHAGCVLTRSVPSSLRGVDDQGWWWAENLTLDAWCSEVEKNPVFRECMTLADWTWSGFSD